MQMPFIIAGLYCKTSNSQKPQLPVMILQFNSNQIMQMRIVIGVVRY